MISMDPILNILGVYDVYEVPEIHTQYRFAYYQVNACFVVNFISVVFVVLCSYIAYFMSYIILFIL